MLPSALQKFVTTLVQGNADGLPLPDRPSIAVLPFINMSGDQEQEHFSDGIADDIITELSRNHLLFVIARNSSFTYRGRSVDVKQAARALGVRYIVEGSVRREAHRVRINAQLIVAESGNNIWAERYDREIEHVFAVQDEIATAVASAVGPAVGDAERRRVLRKVPGSLSAWEAYQRGLSHLAKGTPHANGQARSLFQQATSIDSGFAPAFAALAQTYAVDALFYGALSLVEAGRMMEPEARKAIEADPNDFEAHAALASAFAAVGDLAAAQSCADRAISLNRNSAYAHMVKSVALVNSGRWMEGRVEALISLRLNPYDPSSPQAANTVASSYYYERNYQAALGMARRTLIDYPALAASRRFFVAALGQLGLQEEAAAALRNWMTVTPRSFDTFARNRPPFVRPEDHEHLLEGLRKAGWQG